MLVAGLSIAFLDPKRRLAFCGQGTGCSLDVHRAVDGDVPAFCETRAEKSLDMD